MFNIDTSGIDRLVKKLEDTKDIKKINQKIKSINKDAYAHFNEKGELVIDGLNHKELEIFKKNFLS